MHIIEDFEEWAHHRHHQTSAPVPTFTPAASSPSSQPEVQPMSTYDEVAHFLTVADEGTVRVLNFILAHPEGLSLVNKLGAAAALPLPAGALTAAVTGLDALLSVFAQPPAQRPAQGQPAPAQQQADGNGAQPTTS